MPGGIIGIAPVATGMGMGMGMGMGGGGGAAPTANTFLHAPHVTCGVPAGTATCAWQCGHAYVVAIGLKKTYRSRREEDTRNRKGKRLG